MSDTKSPVPIWVRVAVGLLALANLVYGVKGYLQPSTMFPMLNLENSGALDAVYQFAARNTAIGVALCLVALVGVPESIAILIIIRFLIEGQDLVLLMFNGAPVASMAMPVAFMVLEAAIAVLMFRIMAKRDALPPGHERGPVPKASIPPKSEPVVGITVSSSLSFGPR